MDGSPGTDDPLVGSVIGSYRVERALGAGGMGSVYELVHPGIHKRLALKVLHEEYAGRADVVARFFDEARAVNLIGHPNIVDILDFNRLPDGRPYLMMEFLEGPSLGDYLEERGPLPTPEVETILVQLCDALGAAHDAGIVHRDLKPENILLCRRPGQPLYVKVLDFGIAKLRGDLRSADGDTATGVVMGTPVYMSPEQAAGRAGEIDHRADIYAVGVIAFQMLTGRAPFAGESFAELILKHLEEPPPALAELRREVAGDWDPIVRRALAKTPAERFGSMAELARAATRVGTPAPPLEPPRRRPWLPLALALIALATAAAVFAIVREPAADEPALVLVPVSDAGAADAPPAPAPPDAAPPDAAPPDAAPAPRPARRRRPARERPVAGRGTVVVTASPWAFVEVDGARRGQTPLSLELESGRHTLVLSNPEIEGGTAVRRVRVRAGETTRVDVDLRR